MAVRLSILCFGDSLTAGYYNMGMGFAPYGNILEKKLGQQWSVDHIGFCGYTTEEMKETVEEKSVSDVCGREWPGLLPKLAEKPYKFVAILAGTNDIGTNNADRTVENLRHLHKLCLEQPGVERTFALSVPDHGASIQRIIEKRKEVNEAIRAMAAESDGKIVYVDVCEAIPNKGSVMGVRELTEEEAAMWAGDGLHLSPRGSKKLAHVVYDSLQPYLDM